MTVASVRTPAQAPAPVTWRFRLSDLRVSSAQRLAALEVLDSGWLSMGPRTAAFEQSFAAAAGVEHAVAVANGTAALLLALKAVGVSAGDQVVLPSLTFVADASVVRQLGAEPVFADVTSVDRPLLDPDDVLRAVTPRTRAVITVHYGGVPADVAPLVGRGFAVVEDAAHSIGPVAADGSWIPLVGDVAAYSFFANKNLPLGEGGMVTARNPAVAERVRLLRSHAMTSGTWDRHRGHATDYDVVDVGVNARLTEIQAAMGEVGLADLPLHNDARRRLLAVYGEALAGSGVRLAFSGESRTTGHIAVAVLPEAGSRPRIRAALAGCGIQSSFHYPPIHGMTAYRDPPARSLPRTEEAAEQFVTLPLHPYLTDEDVREIAAAVRGVL
jgi:dTDP-4-amino-4,6-dideoxygalactose transaminase